MANAIPSAPTETREVSLQVYRLRQAALLLGVSETTLWRMQRRGEIPPPIRISPGACGYTGEQLRDVIKSRLVAR